MARQAHRQLPGRTHENSAIEGALKARWNNTKGFQVPVPFSEAAAERRMQLAAQLLRGDEVVVTQQGAIQPASDRGSNDEAITMPEGKLAASGICSSSMTTTIPTRTAGVARSLCFRWSPTCGCWSSSWANRSPTPSARTAPVS
ncbi:hypothetical protein [Aphanothece minutissima]|uniref:hypothetical protein n=1 Tax=Aphanothece minutissima TaxID=543815 RepID=UPI001C62FA3C|nr:hypothetical protein [Aphanothece minutissima]